VENWRDVSISALRAAQSMRESPRSSISRAYYAAYSGIAYKLSKTRGVYFPAGQDGPNHRELPALIEHHFNRLTPNDRKKLKAGIRRLYKARLDSDYHPKMTVDKSTAQQSLSDAKMIMSKMEIL